jgi:hypothetical protein
MASVQDVYIKFFGYDAPGQQGMVLSQSDEARAFAQRVNTPAYLAQRLPLRTIWLVGGEGKKNRCREVVDVVKKIVADGGSTGSIVITGGSAGGKNALETAGLLTAERFTIRYVGLCDAAFQKDDIKSQPPLVFKAPPIMCLQRENWFQSWGHTLDPNQELHGQVDGFSNNDLTPLTLIQQIKMRYRHSEIDAQDALEEAHVAAYQHAFRAAETKIVWMLGQNATP